jgi:hypothetical protein
MGNGLRRHPRLEQGNVHRRANTDEAGMYASELSPSPGLPTRPQACYLAIVTEMLTSRLVSCRY